MVKKLFLALLASIAFNVPVVQAALIQIDVTGVIYQSQDVTGTVFGLGAGTNTAVGQTVTTTFTFDTTAVPPDTLGGADPTFALYGSCGTGVPSWLDSSASVGGGPAVWSPTTGTSSCDSIEISNGFATSGYEVLAATNRLEFYQQDATGYDYRLQVDSFGVAGYSDWLSSLALDQTASLLVPLADAFTGQIYRLVESASCLPGQACVETFAVASAVYYVTGVSMRPVGTVPEPASLALLGAGLAALVLVRRRRAG